MKRDKSLLDNEATQRKYRLLNNDLWIVQNEYQIINCPDCGKNQHIRYTHIYSSNPQDQRVLPLLEFHPNYNKELDYLNKLLVTYRDGESVKEVLENGKWVLKKGEKIIGKEEN